jgi:hypothetical protein
MFLGTHDRCLRATTPCDAPGPARDPTGTLCGSRLERRAGTIMAGAPGSRVSVSAAFLGASPPQPKIPFPAAGFGGYVRSQLRPAFPVLRRRSLVFWIGCRRYSGFSPSVSNCPLHSVGGSRSRSIPIPRGRRPSTAAFTRLGVRNASELVMLTCRTLHFSRTQNSATGNYST